MKTVVITGGTVRLGRVISEHLRARGWRVITASHRADAGADVVADLSAPSGAAALYAKVLGMLGGMPPDALVNNAALFTGDDEAVRNVGFESAKKLTILMGGRENGRGSVVNITDACAAERSGAYGETKRALERWTKEAAAMFPDTLTVNAVAPGPVMASEDVHEKAGKCPLGRPTPEAVACAVEFLLNAKFTSGAIIMVDGGRSNLV